jgi:hypothetical protein
MSCPCAASSSTPFTAPTGLTTRLHHPPPVCSDLTDCTRAPDNIFSDAISLGFTLLRPVSQPPPHYHILGTAQPSLHFRSDHFTSLHLLAHSLARLLTDTGTVRSIRRVCRHPRRCYSDDRSRARVPPNALQMRASQRRRRSRNKQEVRN